MSVYKKCICKLDKEMIMITTSFPQLTSPKKQEKKWRGIKYIYIAFVNVNLS